MKCPKCFRQMNEGNSPNIQECTETDGEACEAFCAGRDQALGYNVIDSMAGPRCCKTCEGCEARPIHHEDIHVGSQCLSWNPNGNNVIPSKPIKPKREFKATDSCFNCNSYSSWGLCNKGNQPRVRWGGILRCKAWNEKK